MSYEKKISRAAPGLIVCVLDDSGSMGDHLPGTTDPKYKWVERLCGVILKAILAMSTELSGNTIKIKPRYFVYIIVYGTDPKVWGTGEMDIQAAVEKYSKDGNSLGLGGKAGGTYADKAFCKAHEYLKEAVKDERFRASFPPMLFHLTDGMSATDPTNSAEQVKQLATQDGNVLVVNAFIGTQTKLSYQGPEDFPGYLDVSQVGPNQDNIRLFKMSSTVPACIRQNLIDDGIFPQIAEGARLFFDVRTKDMLKHTIQVVGSLGSRADQTTRSES
jgi:hypothetical protein